jgi:hypothetical protein
MRMIDVVKQPFARALGDTSVSKMGTALHLCMDEYFPPNPYATGISALWIPVAAGTRLRTNSSSCRACIGVICSKGITQPVVGLK